jgi:protein-tyrosine phosphatase
MAEFILKDMVSRIGREADFFIDSAATSSEELGNPVYPPARRILAEHGISCEGKTARRCRAEEYDDFDLILGMDHENMVTMVRRFSGDPENKVHNLLDFAGRIGEEIPDPWYTGDFQSTWDDLQIGCLSLLNALNRDRPVVLDFASCLDRADMFALMRRKMLWPEEYGNNLDALYDILTGLPHYGERFVLMPPDEIDLLLYFEQVSDVFRDAGTLVGADA